jgi:hypothetical protein
MSPSIHPLPTVARPAGAVALPSGLGAGGRGKEKAPCRYLHYAVDLPGDVAIGNGDGSSHNENGKDEHQDEDDVYGGSMIRNGKEEKPKRTHRIEVGLGPIGKGHQVVRMFPFQSTYTWLMYGFLLPTSGLFSTAPTSMALLRSAPV